MKRFIGLALILLCLFSLTGCGGETLKVEYDEASLYTGGDIRLSLTYASPTTETVKILVENKSGYELTYGQPFLSFSRRTSGGWKTIVPDPNWAYTAEGYWLSPGESVELEVSTKRYLDGLKTDKQYRACFEFWYSPENSEDEGNGNFGNGARCAYVVHDFSLSGATE